jgi:hypothetical protein
LFDLFLFVLVMLGHIRQVSTTEPHPQSGIRAVENEATSVPRLLIDLLTYEQIAYAVLES